MIEKRDWHGLFEFIFFVPSAECWFDNYTLIQSTDSDSGNWEVWRTEPEGTLDVTRHEDVEYVPEDKILEIVGLPEEVSLEMIHIILGCFRLGVDSGEENMKRISQQTAKFALGSLVGDIQTDELQDAADQHYHMLKLRNS